MDGGDFIASSGSPLFFVSYARGSRVPTPAPPKDPDEHVLRFFGDLVTHVNELVSPPTGVDIGFIDRSIDGGERWRDELLSAARTCQVFVPLISPKYPRSEWCMREWETFALRKIHKRDPTSLGSETAIVPVNWVPTNLGSLPGMIQDIQFFVPEGLPVGTMAENYRHNGLYGLLITHQDDAYANVVWKLAQRVADICDRHWVEPMPAQRRSRRRRPKGTT